MNTILGRVVTLFLLVFSYQPKLKFPIYPQPLINNTTSIYMMSYNLWGLPVWIPGSDQGRRFKALPQNLDLDRIDIFCFQETFSQKLRNLIIRELTPYYFSWSEYECNKSIIGPLKRDCYGGLMTWSKFPILSETFYEYPKDNYQNIEEKVGSKGVLVSNLLVQEQILIVVNTHLYAGKSHEAHIIRHQQLRFIRKILTNNPKYKGLPILLAGDLNINHPDETVSHHPVYHQKSYNYLLDSLGFSDTCPVLDEECYTVDHRKNRYVLEDNPLQKLDYILYKSTLENQIEIRDFKVGMQGPMNLSDHFSCEIEFQISAPRSSKSLSLPDTRPAVSSAKCLQKEFEVDWKAEIQEK